MANESHDATAVERVIGALLTTTRPTEDFDDAENALLAYAERLTREPAAVSASDVERLRAAGFDDRAIHDACAIVSYFAFVNRIADGLG
ncbi:MAG: peroxidase, partial [Gemmatimonadota bacterium]|nr:peroxidase [Gemmatimonadota bacterium]